MDTSVGGGAKSGAHGFTQSELDAVSHASYFQCCVPEKDNGGRVYDAVFHLQPGYEPRVSRDDKAVSLQLNVNREERKRSVPVLSSSAYGWNVCTPLEHACKKNVRVQMVNKGFYRSRGTCIPLETELSSLDDTCTPQ